MIRSYDAYLRFSNPSLNPPSGNRRGQSRQGIRCLLIRGEQTNSCFQLSTKLNTFFIHLSMSHLTYYNYPGVGENNQKKFLYSQAVRIGAVQVKVRLLIQLPAGNSCRTNSCRAGMLISGGWVRETGEFFKEINAQIDQAFENCEVALKSAGGKGWSQVLDTSILIEQGKSNKSGIQGKLIPCSNQQ